MSTPAAPPGAAIGASAALVCSTGVLGRPNRCPATSAMSATSAIAATAHGSALLVPRSDAVAGGAAAPAGVPQRWQNFAPAVSDARQAVHWAPASGAPQLEQNFPEAVALQAGHVLVADAGGGADAVMAEK
jgi:hypothetical protein